MRDLTKGSVSYHLLNMAAFIGMGLVFQTLYFLIDLYFVAQLGNAAIAGVSAAGNFMFLVMAATQIVGVGGMALAAQATGRKDQADANHVINQAFAFALACGALTLVLGYVFADALVGSLAADAETAAAGRTYLHAFLPSLALMFPATALITGWRATGVVGPGMVIQTLSVIINACLAPMLIAGWLTGVPLGVAGAGLASSIASVISFTALVFMFPRVQKFLRLQINALKPRFATWWRIIAIGLPSAGEFLLLFIIITMVYWLIRDFGPHAQAGFGVGSRVMQSIFLPAMAVAFAVAPIVGQNFGARHGDRVIATFRAAAIMSTIIMFALSLLTQWRADLLLGFFTKDPEALAVGAHYLHILSWNFVATGLVFCCSSTFQGLGDTRPALIAAFTRFITFVAPALWLSQQPGFSLDHVWYLSVASVAAQAGVCLVLLWFAFKKKIGNLAAPDAAPVSADPHLS